MTGGIFVDRVFREENVGYRIDEEGLVHYFVDEAFERTRLSSIACLDRPEYAATRELVEQSRQFLDSDPMKQKEAIRAVFEAVENLFQILFGEDKIKALGAHEVERHVKPLMEVRYRGNSAALNSGAQVRKSLQDWINAAHIYRHAQRAVDPEDPPMSLALAILSQGHSLLRLLVELNHETSQQ